MLPHWLEVTESCSKIAAVVLGGSWAYYKYFRSRTFVTRLELAVSGSIFKHNTITYCIASARLKNVGLSNADIIPAGTCLIVQTCNAFISPFINVPWVLGRVYPIFAGHKYAEPGECIENHILIALPANQIAVKLELQVISAGQVQWQTEEIVIALNDTLR